MHGEIGLKRVRLKENSSTIVCSLKMCPFYPFIIYLDKILEWYLDHSLKQRLQSAVAKEMGWEETALLLWYSVPRLPPGNVFWHCIACNAWRLSYEVKCYIPLNTILCEDHSPTWTCRLKLIHDAAQSTKLHLILAPLLSNLSCFCLQALATSPSLNTWETGVIAEFNSVVFAKIGSSP